MIRLGITGGIGSGKSFVCRLLEEQYHIPIYYCDDEAKRLNVEHPVIRRELKELVGNEVYAADGSLNKPLLAGFLFANPENARQVNRIIHPVLFQDFEQWAARQEAPVVGTESAILFESGMDRYVDYSLLVTAPMEVRLQRIIQRDHTTLQKAQQRIQAQMSDEEKRERASFTLLNDGVTPLEPQLRQLIKFF